MYDCLEVNEDLKHSELQTVYNIKISDLYCSVCPVFFNNILSSQSRKTCLRVFQPYHITNNYKLQQLPLDNTDPPCKTIRLKASKL